MGADNGTIVARLLEIYQALIAQNEEEEGVPVEAYKNIDIDALPDALNRVSWEGNATDVAGRLASNLILKHALPNANHRTAVALVQFYLRRIAPDFSMPETSVEIDSETYDWREWVNEYINESKRLLTVRRKNVLLKHLSDFGATTLERKHEVQIDLTAYELDMYPAEAKTVYATAHEELWIEFVEEAVERTDNPELMEAPGLSKAEFAEKIRTLE
jgi:prophage maintenance system killer protein